MARPERCDVIIIGGGIMGSAIAYYTSKMGKKVLVVEKNDQASGSAGATDGVVGYHTKKPGVHMDLAVQSIAMFPSLSQELGVDIEYTDNCGGMIPVQNGQQWEIMEQIGREQSESGVDIHMIGIKEAIKLEPQLNPKLLGCLYTKSGGKVHPIFMTFAFASAAKKRGVVYMNETEVTAVVKDGDRAAGVTTTKGDFYADKIVISAGSWSAAVGELAGVSIPVKPRKGQILISEPIGPFVHCTVQCAQYYMIKHRPDAIKDTYVVRTGSSLSFGQTDDGALMIGATRELVGFDRENTLESFEAIARRAVEFFPALGDVHIIRSFAGLRPYTPDGLPLLGESDTVKGLYIATGHEGDGIALSPATGKFMAELLVNGESSFPLEPFNPNRFK